MEKELKRHFSEEIYLVTYTLKIMLLVTSHREKRNHNHDQVSSQLQMEWLLSENKKYWCRCGEKETFLKIIFQVQFYRCSGPSPALPPLPTLCELSQQ